MRPDVVELRLTGWADPADVALSLEIGKDNEPVVWLDSGPGASTGFSYIGFGSRVATAVDGSVTVDGAERVGTIFDLLRTTAQPLTEQKGFRLGWVGWLGYGLHRQTIVLNRHETHSLARYPDAALLFADRAIVFDHFEHTMTLIALTDALLAELRSRLEQKAVAVEPDPALAGSIEWSMSDEEYLDAIAACQHQIAAGNAYQLCLTNEVRVAVRPDPLRTYLALRRSSPSHHGCFFRVGEWSLLGSSPEVFVSISPAGEIESKPIKGTRPRGVNAAEDEQLAADLLGSEKERAENLMIVDLMRNDIGRVSTIGSVTVPSLLTVESYAQVHQLVSTVRGRLAGGLDPIDVVVSCFPAGSMTGAPKSSAIAILAGLEHRERGVYAGAFGYFGLDGRIELSMVIRSIVLDDIGATIGTGGGITALSVAKEELQEMHLKAAALLAVLGVVPVPTTRTGVGEVR